MITFIRIVVNLTVKINSKDLIQKLMPFPYDVNLINTAKGVLLK